MKCDRCNKEASIQIVVMSNAFETKTLNLCTECAQEAMNFSFPLQEGINGYQYFQDSLKKLIGVFFDEAKTHIEEENNKEKGEEKHCSFCDANYTDIMESGRFGCDHCYEEFSDQVRETLRMTQGATRHIGEVPEAFQEKKHLQDEIERKKKQLQDLILAENYEEAAVIRDEMKKLITALYGGEN